MKLKDLFHIRQLLVITYSSKPSSESSQFNFSANKLLILFLFYSLIVFILGFIIIEFTPIKKVFSAENELSQKEQHEKLLELNKKVIFLSKEIEELKSTNERLRYAIILGDSNAFKNEKPIHESKPKISKKKTEGNLLSIFQYLLENIFFTAGEDIHFIKPINGFVSRDYNPEEGHYGIDIIAKNGSPVYAAAGGYVVFSDFTVDDGYMIIIVHPNDYISIYKHCSSLLKNKKEKIVQGELIALAGNTGHKSHGPHLHFELWKNGKPLNPEKLFIN